jgi:hypothetical protein
MKNLKKLLALVLVAVMVLSFGAIGASAAFTDTTASTYTEAIGVLSGIGVINGNTATTYNPTGSLDRASAAKIITYMLLGPTNAALISSAASQTFSDVPTTHWASGYIDYCASTGIIAGTGDGTFNPNGTLTTLAFTKMLLVALGYNADIEGYVGSNWAINIASDALSAGVYDSTIPMSGNATCTREQAAQLSFKALTAKTVQYTGGSTIKIGDSTITTGATRSDVTNGALAESILDDNFMQFAEKYFPKLTKFVGFSGGRNGYFWQNGTAFITGFVSSDVVLATSAIGYPIANLAAPTDLFYIGFAADSALTYYYNDAEVEAYADADDVDTTLGVDLPAGTVYYNTDADTFMTTDADDDIDSANDANLHVAGAIVNFVDTGFNNKYDVVSMVKKTVEKLVAAPTTRTAGSVNYITIGGIGEQNALYVVAPADLAKGDVILWYRSGITYFVEKATVVTGTIASYKDDVSVKIGDTSYAISGLVGMPTAFNEIDELEGLLAKAGYTFYLDNGKNIVYVVAPSNAATTTNTFFVADTDAISSFSDTTYKAKIVKMDGASDVITVLKTAEFGGTPAYVVGEALNSYAGAGHDDAAIDNGELVKGYFYTYAANADGTYNLTAAQYQAPYETTVATPGDIAIGDDSYTVTKGQAYFLKHVITTANDAWTDASPDNVTAVRGTASTTFLQYSAIFKTYSAYTGVNNVPNYAAGGTIYVLMDSTNTYAQAVVCIGGAADTTTATYTRVYPTSSATIAQDGLGFTTYTYTAIVNGVVGQTITSYTALTKGVVYYCNDFIGDAIGYTVSTTAEGIRHTNVTALDYNGSTLFVNSDSDDAYVLSDSVVIFTYNSTTKAVTQISPDVAATLTYDNDTATLLATSPINSAIAYIYLTID